MTFILVMYIFAGPFSKGDSVALTTVGEFAGEQACMKAGQRGTSLTLNTMKEYRFVCVPKQ